MAAHGPRGRAAPVRRRRRRVRARTSRPSSSRLRAPCSEVRARARCSRVEIGPGTGKATRRLLELGADLLAVEPDPRLAEHLPSAVGRSRSSTSLSRRSCSLPRISTSPPPPPRFTGLTRRWGSESWRPRCGEVVGSRSGGAISVRRSARSPFQQALRPVVDEILRRPRDRAGGKPVGRAPSARLAPVSTSRRALTALAHAGFGHIEHELIPWSHTWDAAGSARSIASFSPIIRLDEATRSAVLDAVEDVAERDLDGRVELLDAHVALHRPAAHAES